MEVDNGVSGHTGMDSHSHLGKEKEWNKKSVKEDSEYKATYQLRRDRSIHNRSTTSPHRENMSIKSPSNSFSVYL